MRRCACYPLLISRVPFTNPTLANPTRNVFCCLLYAQKLTRLALTTATREAQPLGQELLRELSVKSSVLAQLCAPLKAALSVRRKPNVQLAYFSAAAVAAGVLPDSYPIAIR